jgi:uncharacterized membrane protein
MSWRGSTTFPDRIFACLPYLLPLIGSLGFGSFLFRQFPVLEILLIALRPVLTVYADLQGPIGQVIAFFALFILVVRNAKDINDFIRVNTMQAVVLLMLIIYLTRQGQIGQIILFFALFVLVVRNEKINHFIRFNTMQAILLKIFISLCSILLPMLTSIPGSGFAMETLANTIFLGILAAVGYSVFQSLMGKYAEIPAISDAVHMQVR